uniref:AsmA family protein n=1 Tax=Orrella sp. TaxID=1921583 RepID=UPI004047E7F2
MRLLFRSCAWVLVLLALLLSLLLVTLNTPLGHSLLKQALKHWVHPNVVVNGSMDLSIWPTLTIAADDLVVTDPKDKQAWLSIGQFRLDLGWQGLLGGQVRVNAIRLNDVTVWRTGRHWQPLLSQMGEQGVLGAQAFKRPWQRLGAIKGVPWQLQIDTFVVEQFNVVQRARVENVVVEQPLVSLDRLLLSTQLQANPVPVGEITAQAQGLSIEPEASETFHAALEQVGLGVEGAWVVERFQSRWQLSDGVARADSLTALGAWGDVSASAGSIDLVTGQMTLPLRVKLNGDLNLQTRGIQIRTRQSELSFVLSGPLDNLGIESPVVRPKTVPIPVLINRN